MQCLVTFFPIMLPIQLGALSHCNAGPSGIAAPQFSFTADGAVVLTWQPPTNANGLVTSYTLIRSTSIFTGLAFNFTDTTVVPGQTYVYTLQVSTAGGSATTSVIVTTPDQVPLGLAAPAGHANSTFVRLTWTAPAARNGIIFSYQILLNDTEVFRDLALTAAIGGLTPFTTYSAVAVACNSAGCARSAPFVFRTLPAGP
jgi:hypothetical protein